MSDHDTDQVDDQDTPQAPADVSDDGQESGEVDWKAKFEAMRSEMRKQEQRAKDNKAAADRLAELEGQDKTELQKTLERAEAAEKERDAAVMAAMRLRIATEHSISAADADLFLNGTDEETLTRQAEALAQRQAPKPPESPGQGIGGDGAGSRSAAESWAKSLLGK